MVRRVHVQIAGFIECPFFVKAVNAAKKVHEAYPEDFTYDLKQSTRPEFHAFRERVVETLQKKNHVTCPLVYTALNNKPRDYIGGCDDFCNFLRTEYSIEI